jgi:hypothetical protein
MTQEQWEYEAECAAQAEAEYFLTNNNKMTTEETKCKILQVFGYTPEDLNCANADTAMGEIFEQDSFTDPMSMFELFIVNCSNENFAELKEILTEQMS